MSESPSEMSILEWAEDAERRLQEFIKWWAEERAKEPEMFADKMSAGEWDEQYRCYEGG